MICKGCLKEKGNSSVCPICGYVEGSVPEESEALSPGTVLDARYLVGNIISSREDAITYRGYDRLLDLFVFIRQKRVHADENVFLQKARWFAHFKDNHSIIDIYDCRKICGMYFMILEHAEGTLAENRIRESIKTECIQVQGQDILLGKNDQFHIIDFDVLSVYNIEHGEVEFDVDDERTEFLRRDTLLHQQYRILKPLGRGGFGITYLALDEVLNRFVAIKEYMPSAWVTRSVSDQCVEVVSSAVLDWYKRGLQNFCHEAVYMAKFNDNPLIASAYDFFSQNETAYIVMEYVDGRNIGKLGKLIGGFEYRAAKEIFRNILCAVKDIHQKGIIHGDISPGNVMIDKRSDVKLIDFGSAHFPGKKHTTLAGMMIKPGYAAIEQYDEEYTEDQRSDVYQSAATFYTLITGERPMEANVRWNGDELKFPSELGIWMPQSDEMALRKAMEIRPDHRMSGIKEFMDDLYGADD